MNKFIYILKKNIISVFIFLLISSIAYIAYSNFHSSGLTSSILDNKASVPNILVTKGSAIIRRDGIIKLSEKDRADLKKGDKIKTFEDSSATVFWPDGSITRLGPKSGIEINELHASDDLSSIKIKFNLEEGKTWSNIVKFIGKNSYFTETYEDGNYAATVRGTVFEMNLEEGYLHAVDHDVTLTDSDNSKTSNVTQGGAKNLYNIMSNVPSEVWDKDWIQSNLQKDSEYIQELALEWKRKLEKSVKGRGIGTKVADYMSAKIGSKRDLAFSSLSDSLLNGGAAGIENVKEMLPSLSEEEKKSLNKDLLRFYQKVHFLPNDDDTAVYKSGLREIILNTTDDSDKKALLKNFARLNIYDYIEVTKDKASKVSEILKKNIDGYLNQMTDPQELKDLLGSFGSDMLDIIGVDFEQVSKESGEIIGKLKDENFQKNLKEKILKDSENLNDKIDNLLNR